MKYLLAIHVPDYWEGLSEAEQEAETKERHGGFYLLDCASAEEFDPPEWVTAVTSPANA